MDFKKHPNGAYYKITKSDYKDSDIPGFKAAVKKLKTWSWPCPDILSDDWQEWAFIGRPDFKTFGQLKVFYIDNPKRDAKELKQAGYKPQLRTDSQFRRRAVVRKPTGV